MSTVRAARSLGEREAPATPSRRSGAGDEPTRPPQLRVVDPRRRPTRRRIIAVVGVLAAFALFGSLLGLAVFHTFLVESQSELDRLDNRIAEADSATDQLRLDVAELRAPDRIRQVALDDLGMVAPTEVLMLTPAVPGEAPATVGVLADAPGSGELPHDDQVGDAEQAVAGE